MTTLRSKPSNGSARPGHGDDPPVAADGAHLANLQLLRLPRDAFLAVLARLKAEGLAILYVSHKLEEVFAAADRISVLRNGRSMGTLAYRNAANAKMASKVTTSSAGPRLRAVSWMGCAARSTTTSSSTRACIWIA